MQTVKVPAPPFLTPTAHFGAAVALTTDLAFVGAPDHDLPYFNGGSVVLLDRSQPGLPVHDAIGSNNQNRHFGSGFAIVAPDQVVVASAGLTYWPVLCVPAPDGWTRTGGIRPLEATPAYLPAEQSIAADGPLVVVGIPNPCLGPLCGGIAFSGTLVQAPDCNGNDFLDACDIVAGISTDLNENELPDECDDCNGNGVPDVSDIAGGTSADCDGDFNPDECQIAAEPSIDCDGDGLLDSCVLELDLDSDCDHNGVPDACDVARDPGLDCNGNGTLDLCETLAGLEADCDTDGLPDACEIGADPSLDCDGNGVIDECDAVYANDDDSPETSWGTGSSAKVDLLWLNSMMVRDGAEELVEISVCWIRSPYEPANYFLPPGYPVTLLVLADPTDDGIPEDAQPMVVLETEVGETGPGEFQTFPIPQTSLGAAGEIVYLGVHCHREAGAPGLYPAVATSKPEPQTPGWMAAAPSGSGWAGSIKYLIHLGAVKPPSAFLVRGRAIADVLADLDCDGAIGSGDLGELIALWGACAKGPSCEGDLDHDGDVDAGDLGLLLAMWDVQGP